MEKANAVFIVVLVFFFLVCVSGLFVSVSAATLRFIDVAYIGNGTLTVSNPDNSLISVLNSTESITLSNSTAYMLDYEASGFVNLKEESVYHPVTGFSFPSLHFIFLYFSDPTHLIAAFLLVLCIIIVVAA